MKLKHNLILLIILIIFASVILLFERPFENKAKKTRDEASPLFPDLKIEQVKKIVVKISDTSTKSKALNTAFQNQIYQFPISYTYKGS